MPYFDTSFLVPLFVQEAATPFVVDYFSSHPGEDRVTSRWTRLEFSSFLGISVRRQLLTAEEAERVEVSVERLLASFTTLEIGTEQVEVGSRMMREHRLGLRAGDALHLATARVAEISRFLTLDKTLIRAGRHYGIETTAGVGVPGYEDWQ